MTLTMVAYKSSLRPSFGYVVLTCMEFSVGSYECTCNDGYEGSRCERYIGENEEECENGQIYVPYPSIYIEENDKEPEKGEGGNTDEKSRKDVCFSAGKNLTFLYFETDLLEKLRNESANPLRADVAAMRIELEDWLKKVMEVWYEYADSYDEEGYYNLSDVSVLDDFNVYPHHISLPVIARVGDNALSTTGFLCSLSRTSALKNCSQRHGYPPYKSEKFSFKYFLCPTLNSVNISKCLPQETASSGASTGGHNSELPTWSIYLLASLGAALFLFVLLFACYADRSQKFNLQQALRNRAQYDHVRLPEEDDEHYRDVMFRHHISTSGEINPIYGFNEQEDESQMIANPLYGMARRVESPQVGHAKSFENPLYSTLERQPGLRAKPVGKEAN